MVYDNIKNKGQYLSLSQDIRAGLEFLADARMDIEAGEYPVTEKVKAIVSEYETKKAEECLFEAHRTHIDIQYLVSGEEGIDVAPTNELLSVIGYSAEKDAGFFTVGDSTGHYSNIVLGDGFFCILFPNDGHKPQLAVNGSQRVKKIVIKVEI